MIFLSAQPDDSYFIWQLELQLHNFNKLNIASGNIHVLIGFDKNNGLNPQFELFIKTNKQAIFFIYADTRKDTFYPSSLRPHLIKKHLKAYPRLENKSIFYHDSDIIFRVLPDFNKLLKSNTWHVSNAKEYLDSQYLKSKGEGLFENMCDIVGISQRIVIENDNNAGGAQYLLTNSTYEFWDKVEKDCVKLYFILNIYEQLNSKIIGLNPKDNTPIQAWCADMWSLLWNAWKFGHKTHIDKELDFCWPHQHINHWNNVKIYHDAGVTEPQRNKYFYKHLYKTTSPYKDDLSFIQKDSCSFKYVENLIEFIKLTENK